LGTILGGSGSVLPVNTLSVLTWLVSIARGRGFWPGSLPYQRLLSTPGFPSLSRRGLTLLVLYLRRSINRPSRPPPTEPSSRLSSPALPALPQPGWPVFSPPPPLVFGSAFLHDGMGHTLKMTVFVFSFNSVTANLFFIHLLVLFRVAPVFSTALGTMPFAARSVARRRLGTIGLPSELLLSVVRP
jgi:hypothetical protein